MPKIAKRTRFCEVSQAERDEYLSDLKDFVEMLEKELDYDVFLVYGGLLAAIREKNVILHDKDIDICLVAKSKNEYQALEKELHAIIFALFGKVDVKRTCTRERSEWGGLRFTAWANEKHNLYFDIYLCFEDPERPDQLAISSFHSRLQMGNKRFYSSIPKAWVFPLDRSGILGEHIFNIPAQPDTCLSIWYGLDWSVEQQNFYRGTRGKWIKNTEESRVTGVYL